MDLFNMILKARGIEGEALEVFLNPNYDNRFDPFLLPDMKAAVDRLVRARESQENVVIYGDYDIDGLTATTLLLDSLEQFGFKNVDAFIPNRFVEGYGLAIDAINRIADDGANLIITVDCGSLSHKEIVQAKSRGVDVIVTDHHNVAKIQPPAIAVINPKRLLDQYPNKYENYQLIEKSKNDGKLYPFLDLAGVGVAFKLVQAMQTRLGGLDNGQEKWLLDLVALGTVCDVVNLTSENRTFVHYGLKVLSKTRRKGLLSLMDVSGVTPDNITTRSLGFALGPRMNAAGRLETARVSLDLLRAEDTQLARELARKLDVLNTTRKADQEKIFREAVVLAETFSNDPVLVVSGVGWNHGIVGIVAAKLMEMFKKPAIVMEEMGDEAKGSGRSYGDFSIADAIRAADDVITKGGGHKYAAGLTLPVKNIPMFRKIVNDYYRTQKLFNQESLLLSTEDVVAPIANITEHFVEDIKLMEPFGNGNPEPIISTQNLRVFYKKNLGSDGQHVKLGLRDFDGNQIYMIAFNAPEHFFVDTGERVTVWYKPTINEWQGRRSIEGFLQRLERA